jgi:uncharacterized BrkB/YihY/UPF0761 family membrane protein
MISATWRTLKDVVLSFIGDEALTRGAAIAFYTATSIAPVLLIAIAGRAEFTKIYANRHGSKQRKPVS